MRLTLFKNTKHLLFIILISVCAGFSLNAYALQGGQSVTASDYPGQAMISYDQIPNVFLGQNCSGIVLEPRKILTSASCVYTLSTTTATFVPIPANNIYVHPSSDGTVGPFSLILSPSTTPNFRVASYVVHPQNPFAGGHHNLAVLTLSANINIEPATLYNGSNTFIGGNGTALGWKRQDAGGFPIVQQEYVLNQLLFPLVEGDTNINGLCYDNFNDTGTVFCGGFRNGANFLESYDEGAPMYRIVNGRRSVIGILFDASNGLLFDGQYQYEEYARVSSMVNFISQHAPNTQFWNESSVPPDTGITTIPFLKLLLLDE